MQLQVDKRFSPRTTITVSSGLLPGNIECNVLNISETGICFECKGPALSGDILLSMDLSLFKSKQPTEISARVMWHKILAENRFQFGAQFSLSNGDRLSRIRDFIFDIFAKKAVTIVKDSNNKDMEMKVADFFSKDIRQYHEELSTLVHEIDDGKIEPEEADNRLTVLTNELLLKGNAVEEIVNNVCMKKIKQLFRELTGCWFYKSPIMKMAYEKPRGYPGDYKLFEIIYDNRPVPENKSIGYYYDKYFLNNTYTTAVRTRKNKMKNILQDLIENNNSPCLNLLNIACGPCREIRELLFDPTLSSRKKLIFTGLDNDEEALKFSKSKLDNLPANVEVRFLHENVLSIFRDSKYYDVIGKQDIIYILGLTEYLPDRIFRRLISFLSQLLNDKGMLVITYKDKDILFPSLPPDWLCNWAFIKRSKDDLINVAKELGSDKYSLRIEREGSGCIFFLILTKT